VSRKDESKTGRCSDAVDKCQKDGASVSMTVRRECATAIYRFPIVSFEGSQLTQTMIRERIRIAWGGAKKD
jgi:hypothetical protein